MNQKKRYALHDRLSDVIRLITVLSLHKHAFRTKTGLEDAIRGKPLSADNWEEIAKNHPEFFRPNFNNEYIALLLRSYFPEDTHGFRKPLTVDETQKLIDVAITLDNNEAEKRKNLTLWFPIIVAVIAVGGVIFNTIYTNSHSLTANQKIDSLSGIVQKIKVQTDKIK